MNLCEKCRCIVKKTECIFLILALLTGLCACGNKKEEAETSSGTYPSSAINGTIMWAAGGACDSISRAVTPHVEDILDTNVVLTNKPGASGAIATNYVYDQKADGYNIIYGAETTALYPVLGISELDYSDFVPLALFATCSTVIIVDKNSPYNTIKDLIDDILSRPGEVTMASSGAGGIPYTYAAMLNSLQGGKVNIIPYDGDGPAKTALMGKHVDFTVCTYISCKTLLESGKVRGLAVVDDKRQEGLDVPAITETYPEYSTYFPFGPFYGVFIKKGAEEDTIQTLTDAFSKAMETEEYRDFVDSMGVIHLGLTGKEAKDYIDRYQRIASWLLYDSGAVTTSPKELGIERYGGEEKK